MVRRSLDDPSLVLNREASWLAFNRRVLEEAENPRNPLLERVKFLAITASNLDEFFEIRVGGLLQRIEDGQTDARARRTYARAGGAAGRAAHPRFHARSVSLLESFRCVRRWRRRAFACVGMKDLTPEQRSFVADYCDRELDPLLTPVTVDPSHPFPRVMNKALCQALLLRRRRRASSTYMGVVTVPRALPRLVAASPQRHRGLYFSRRPGGVPHCRTCIAATRSSPRPRFA